MGIGGNFWELLKPYAVNEDFDHLRNKRVAVDLSFWIVQHETAIRPNVVRNPHLRLTFFRTINLFSKFGAYPVFVVDGTPSPLKSKARIARFYQSSPAPDVEQDVVSIERNAMFVKCVEDCVELIQLLGMPVLKARGEAEALCAQLNSQGYVDACLTSDSDAFLYGAKCVIKSLSPNSKEPFECYYMSDIEAGLGLKRNHLIAISLLVGCDNDLNGVQGIGIHTALRLVQSFDQYEILDRLHEIGNGDMKSLQVADEFVGGSTSFSDETSPKIKVSHCSFCGHPGSKGAHLKYACGSCITSDDNESCLEKPVGFKCDCSSCNTHREEKDKKKQDDWKVGVCKKISMEQNFPNDDIIEMYLKNSHGFFTESDGPCLSWKSVETGMLVDFLAYHQQWKPSYIRQRILPMLSTIFLREMASGPSESLLFGQYEFDSVHRIKVRFGHQFFVVKWKKAGHFISSKEDYTTVPGEASQNQQGEFEDLIDNDDSIDFSDEAGVPHIRGPDGYFMLTDENIELVQSAFPKHVEAYLKEKELKERSRGKKAETTPKNSEAARGAKQHGQLSIKEFYRSAKVVVDLEKKDLGKSSNNSDSDNNNNNNSKEKRKTSSNLPKSVRRRLLFD